MKKFIKLFTLMVLASIVTFTSCTKKSSENTAPVSSGYIGQKAPEESKAVGDIIFNDGSSTPYSSIKSRLSNDGETGTKITKAEQEAAIAVIFYVGKGLSDDSSSRTLGVGLKHEKNGKSWCRYASETDKANAYSENVSLIQCSNTGNAGKLVFQGAKDGSKNLEKIAQFLIAKNIKDDTVSAENYPAFSYAKNYGNQISNLESFNTDWYLPSAPELFEMWQNKEIVDTVIELCGGDKLGTSYYWSSSQYTSIDNNALYMDFYYGDTVIGYKDDDSFYVCAVREF